LLLASMASQFAPRCSHAPSPVQAYLPEPLVCFARKPVLQPVSWAFARPV
jgi:hypothetical protein